MYKAGLILTLIAQIVVTLIMIALAAIADTIFGLVGVFAGLAVMYIISVVVTSLALSNLSKVENGTGSFNSTLATAAGVLGLFTNLLGGILTLVGMSKVKNNYSQNRAPANPSNRR